MNAEIVTDFDTYVDLMMCCHLEYDLATMMPDHFDIPETRIMIKLKELFETTWLMGFTHNGELIGFILLEWYHRECTIHICKFMNYDWRKCFIWCLKQLKGHCDKIIGYIPPEKKDVLRMAKAMGFQEENIEERNLTKLTLNIK